MKKIGLSIILILVLAFAADALAQITEQKFEKYESGFLTFNVEGTLTKNDTLYTNAFSFGTEPVMEIFTVAEQADDSVYYTLSREISFFGDAWISDGTIGVDSVTTQKAWADTSSYKNVLQRIKIAGSATKNGSDVSFKLKVSAKKP